MTTKLRVTKALRTVALFEGAKGALVLLAGFELFSFIHKDLHRAAVRLVEHLHFNPAKHYPRIFLDLTEHVTDSQLWAVAVAALIYSVVRFVEATGLWLGKKWAEWFGALTGGMYIPIEIYEVIRGISWPNVTLLVVNIGVVFYLIQELYKKDVGGGPNGAIFDNRKNIRRTNLKEASDTKVVRRYPATLPTRYCRKAIGDDA